jgi:hypothetical protein
MKIYILSNFLFFMVLFLIEIKKNIINNKKETQ